MYKGGAQGSTGWEVGGGDRVREDVYSGINPFTAKGEFD